MDSVNKIKWEWEDLLEMITETENKEILTDILSDDLIILEDFMNSRLGYKRNFQDLIGEKKVDSQDPNHNRYLLSDPSYSLQMKKYKYS